MNEDQEKKIKKAIKAHALSKQVEVTPQKLEKILKKAKRAERNKPTDR